MGRTDLEGLSGHEKFLALVLTKQGLAAMLLMVVLGFVGWYAMRQQTFQNEALVDALEDVRDGIDLVLRSKGIDPPHRRVVRPPPPASPGGTR